MRTASTSPATSTPLTTPLSPAPSRRGSNPTPTRAASRPRRLRLRGRWRSSRPPRCGPRATVSDRPDDRGRWHGQGARAVLAESALALWCCRKRDCYSQPRVTLNSDRPADLLDQRTYEPVPERPLPKTGHADPIVFDRNLDPSWLASLRLGKDGSCPRCGECVFDRVRDQFGEYYAESKRSIGLNQYAILGN